MKKQLKEIKQIESLVKENICTLEDIQRESNIVSAIIEYKSQNNELIKLPPKVEVLLPTFCSKPMDRRKIYKMIGSIKPLSSTTDENGYKFKKQMGPSRELLDTPKVIKAFNTGSNSLSSVSFRSTQKIWTSAEVPEIKCFNINGNSINSIKTKSGGYPNDIAVTSDGCILYSDWIGTVNKVVNGRIEEIIKLLGWVPGNLCVTSTGDLLVVMCNDAKTHCKVVRYSGSVVKQTIQYNENGKRLYSGVFKVKYIAENSNLDICVADRAAGAVVVVSQAGKLRFRYTGHPSKENLFIPRGITTNSQSQILTADCGNLSIHILNQDGQFLRFIDVINEPCGLSVDTLDNLFVAEYKTGDVKVIKYLK